MAAVTSNQRFGLCDLIAGFELRGRRRCVPRRRWEWMTDATRRVRSTSDLMARFAFMHGVKGRSIGSDRTGRSSVCCRLRRSRGGAVNVVSSGRLTNSSIQERWLMKWIERAIRPAPGTAPRDQMMLTASEPGATVQGAAAPAAGWLEPAASPAARPLVDSPSCVRSQRANPGSLLAPIVLVCASFLFGLAIRPTSARAQVDRFPRGRSPRSSSRGTPRSLPTRSSPSS